MRIEIEVRLAAVVLLAMAGDGSGAEKAEKKVQTLREARRGFDTKLARTERDSTALEEPPPELFSIVRYRSPIGEMAAYLGKPPAPGGKHPAIIWITGGFPPGGIDSAAWKPVPAENDQSAKAYRLAGLVMMYPTLRGSFRNPGSQESFFGEVDDVLAALEYLKGIDYVDPQRIYLGGHSTGGTLALLVAEATDGFRAVFAFGPISDPAKYGADHLTYDPGNAREDRLRSPVRFLDSIRTPTFAIEGTRGNIESLREIEAAGKNPALHALAVKGGTHFDILAPLNRLIAGKIAALGGEGKLALGGPEAQAAYSEFQAETREASDLETLASLRRESVKLGVPRAVSHYLCSTSKANLEKAAAAAEKEKFEAAPITRERNKDGDTYFLLTLSKGVNLLKLEEVFAASKAMRRIADDHDVRYSGWWLKK